MEQDRLDILITATGADTAQANVAAVRKEMDAAKQEAAKPANTEGIDAIGESAGDTAKSLGLLQRVIGYFNPAFAAMLGLFSKARLLTLGVESAFASLAATLNGLLRVVMTPLMVTVVGIAVALKSTWDSIRESIEYATRALERHRAELDKQKQYTQEREKSFLERGVKEETALAEDPRTRALMDRQLSAGGAVSGPAFIQSILKQITDMQHEAVLPRDKATNEVLDQLMAGDAPDPVIGMMRSSADWGWMKSTVSGQDAESGQPARSELEIAKLLRPSFLKRFPALRAALKGTHEGEAIRAEGALSNAGMMRAEAERIAPGRLEQIAQEKEDAERRIAEAEAAEAALGGGRLTKNIRFLQRPHAREAIQEGHVARKELADLLGEEQVLIRRAQSRAGGPTFNNSTVIFRPDVYGPNATSQPAIP